LMVSQKTKMPHSPHPSTVPRSASGTPRSLSASAKRLSCMMLAIAHYQQPPEITWLASVKVCGRAGRRCVRAGGGDRQQRCKRGLAARPGLEGGAAATPAPAQPRRAAGRARLCPAWPVASRPRRPPQQCLANPCPCLPIPTHPKQGQDLTDAPASRQFVAALYFVTVTACTGEHRARLRPEVPQKARTVAGYNLLLDCSSCGLVLPCNRPPHPRSPAPAPTHKPTPSPQT
jgi:hypothetical protein